MVKQITRNSDYGKGKRPYAEHRIFEFRIVEVLVVTESEAQLWKTLLKHMARFSGDKGLKNHRKQPHRMRQ